MPSDSRHITSYTCSIVTKTLFRTKILFFSRWPWSGLSKSSKVKQIMPSDSRHVIFCTCSIVTIALSHTKTLFQTYNDFRFATHHLLSVFYSRYSAISHGNPDLQRMTLIWPFKVTKGQTNNVIRFATHDLLSVFYSNYSTMSHENPFFFSRWPWSCLSRSPKVKLIMPSHSRHITSYTCSLITIGLSHTETLFFSRWPWSDLPRSPKVKLIMPSDPWPMSCY